MAALIVLLLVQLPGGSKGAAGKPIVGWSVLGLGFLYAILGIDALMPTAGILLDEIRDIFIIVVGGALGYFAIRKYRILARFESVNPWLIIAAVWVLIELIHKIGFVPFVALFMPTMSRSDVRLIQMAIIPLVLWGLYLTFLVRPAKEMVPPAKEQKNNLNALRLLLASGVVIHHALVYSGGKGFDPGWIAAFLCVSGALIPASRASSKPSSFTLFGKTLTLNDVWVFVSKRVLRVWPAMLIGFYLAWAFFGQTGLKDFVLHTFMIGQISAFCSITLEEICYLTLMILWALGGYKRPPVIWACLAISIFIGFMAQRAIVPNTDATLNGYLGLPQFFFLGNLFWLYGKSIKRVPTIFFIAVGVGCYYLGPYFSGILDQLRGLIFIGCVYATFAYGRPILSWVQRFGDPSYSLFLYHYFPMSELSYHYHLSFWPLFGWSYGISLAVSYASWFAIESPILSLKNRFIPLKGSATEAPVAPKPVEIAQQPA